MSAMTQEAAMSVLFSDITPTPQDDGPTLICSIAYPPEFTQTMDLFRTILLTGELSVRVLALTGMVIDCNAANYTGWFYRRKCLMHLLATGAEDISIRSELEFTTDVGGSNPKNYQVWYHRRTVIATLSYNEDEKKEQAVLELEYVREVLNDDSKNYHAWSHRQFIVRHFGLFEGEVSFCEEMIHQDIRNNSAWNQRFFAIHRGAEPSRAKEGEEGEGVGLKYDASVELEYGLSVCKYDVYNESPFQYLTGILRQVWYAGSGVDDSDELTNTVLTALTEMASEKDKAVSQHVLGLMIEIYVHTAEFDKACEMCEVLLGEGGDAIRAKFWTWKKGTIVKMMK